MGAVISCGCSSAGMPAESDSRCEREFPSGVENTPARPLRDRYKYNCPLCLGYFADILECSCCTQYVCHRCAAAMLRESALLPAGGAIPVGRKLNATCPNCCSVGYALRPVNPTAPVHFLKDDSPPIAEKPSRGASPEPATALETPVAAPATETPVERSSSSFSSEPRTQTAAADDRKTKEGVGCAALDATLSSLSSLSPVHQLVPSSDTGTAVGIVPKRLEFLTPADAHLENEDQACCEI